MTTDDRPGAWVLLSSGLIMHFICKFGGQLWVEQLLRARRPRLVGALLQLGFAFVRVVAPLETFLALYIGLCGLSAASASVECVHGYRGMLYCVV